MKRILTLVAVLAALALASLAGTFSDGDAYAAGGVKTSAYDGGGDSQCQSGTVLNWYSWKWFAYIDGGGYVRLWDDVYSCDGGRYVYVGGFWA